MAAIVKARGWSPAKATAFRESFYDFLGHVEVDSKETGAGQIKLYRAQKIVLDGVFDGLREGIHDFTVLKARQLGISTISYLLTIFYVSVFKAIKGAIVFDTEGNREDFRTLLTRAMDSLPDSHSIAKIRDHRGGMVFENGSTISYLIAGVRKSKGSGGLGRSKGLNFVHATECSSWGDQEGLRSLQQSLAETYENRLYLWESTARGFNMFHDMWEEAKADDLAKKAIFVGWWAKDDYRIPKNTPLFERYGLMPPTVEEAKKITAVFDLYGWRITDEQLAWIRHKTDPAATGDDGTPKKDSDILQQEVPWTEEDCFILTGSRFFNGAKLAMAMDVAKKERFRGYRYFLGNDFLATDIGEARNRIEAHLKIWEEPDPQAEYIIAADPAYASDDNADAYCAQVLRCYADGIDQVAEFRDTSLETYQFTWILAHLAGAYGPNSLLMLEINGPGAAVMNGFRELNQLLTQGYLAPLAAEKGLKDIVRHVRSYMYHRQDSPGSGYAFHWKTTTELKRQAFEQFRDAHSTGLLRVRSQEAIEEMRCIVQDGLSVGADGSKKDDRVMALAMGVRGWHDRVRKKLISQGRTRDLELSRPNLTQADLMAMFHQSIVASVFRDNALNRVREQRLAKKGTRWRW